MRILSSFGSYFMANRHGKNLKRDIRLVPGLSDRQKVRSRLTSLANFAMARACLNFRFGKDAVAYRMRAKAYQCIERAREMKRNKVGGKKETV